MGTTTKRKSYKRRGAGRPARTKRRKVNTTGYSPKDFRTASIVKTNSGYLSTVPIPGGIAPRLRCKLIYDEFYTSRFAGATTYEEAIFRLNSIYDYDYSNLFGNFQPAGRDRLALIYSLYLVRGLKITFEITNSAGNPGTPNAPTLTATWVAWPSEMGTVLPAPPSYPAMLPGSKSISIPLNTTRKLKLNINTEKMSGLSGSPFNSGLGANTGDNPGKPLWGYLKLSQDFYNASDENHWTIKMRTVFDVEYAMPRISAVDTN